MKPDASKHNPRPDYLRSLVDRSGLSQRAAAELIGISDRLMRYYLAPEDSAVRRVAPYPVQFALEALDARPGLEALVDDYAKRDLKYRSVFADSPNCMICGAVLEYAGAPCSDPKCKTRKAIAP